MRVAFAAKIFLSPSTENSPSASVHTRAMSSAVCASEDRVTALAFQAGRLLLLDRQAVVDFADRNNIAIVGFDSGLPPAPTRP
jgi:hypothetical protein